jgi:hypothetical protein
MYIEKISDFERSNTSFLFRSDFVFSSRNGQLLLSSDFFSYTFSFAANISTTNVVLIRNKTSVMIN